MNMIILGITVFCAAIVQLTSGFGFGIVFMAIMPLFFPYKICTVISMLSAVCLQLYTIIHLRKYIQWRYIIVPLITSMCISHISVKMMLDIPVHMMSIVLGVFLLVLAAYMIFLAPKIHLKKGFLAEVLAGGGSGLMAGMFAVGGPPIVAYYDGVLDEPLVYQATIQTFFMLSSSAILIANVIYGNVTREMIPMAAVSIVFTLMGTLVGLKIMKKLSMKTVRKLAYMVMLIAGVYDIIKGMI